MGSTSGPSGSTDNNLSQTPLYRLAKLLNQTTRTVTSPIKDDTPRRLSWER